MSVTEIDFAQQGNGESEAHLISSSQLHEQNLSCLDFVVESPHRLHRGEDTIAQLLSMIEKISDECAQLVEGYSARKESGSTG